MSQKYKYIVFLLLPASILFGLSIIDNKIEKDFNILVVEAKKVVETNFSNEERASLNLNPKIRYIAINPNFPYVPYIKYKLRYCYSYVLKEGSPEQTFYYYK